jgi:hypothetical protein
MKIKVFYWRLALNSLPAASVLESRSMSQKGECKICGATKDTWDHALLHCTMSKCVWALVDEEVTELLSTLHFFDPKH